MGDPWGVIVALMAAFPPVRLGFSSLFDRALGLPEQIRGVHGHAEDLQLSAIVSNAESGLVEFSILAHTILW